MLEKIKITECPRDAMQGLEQFVPTELKAKYINSLIEAGFETIDFGSFVSPKVIPQMRDTIQLVKMLELYEDTNLLAIVANQRGAETACGFDEINIVGFPFSISETFQQKNTNSSIEQSLSKVEEILFLCNSTNKDLMIYLSMAFGNPYNDDWNPDLVAMWIEKLVGIGIKNIALADTVGVSNIENISSIFTTIIPEFPSVEFGAHLHSHPSTSKEKIKAAFDAGCRKFDSAMKGYGGCPMAEDKLVGNIATEVLLEFCSENNIDINIDNDLLKEAQSVADTIFGKYD